MVLLKTICKRSLYSASSLSRIFRFLCHYNTASYLETSSLPTLFFQPYLPQLPIPNLNLSCYKFLAASKPILSDYQYSEVASLVSDLRESGVNLQRVLKTINVDNKHTSYITGPWTDRYLRDRSSVVLTHNPFIGFKPDPLNMDQLERATKIIYVAARFNAALQDNQLKPEIFHLNPKKSSTSNYSRVMNFMPGKSKIYTSYFYYKAFPLDMSQFKYLFNSTRLPLPEKDKNVRNPKAKHISIAMRGNFYTFDVYTEDGSILSMEDIYSNLKLIAEDTMPSPTHPVSILTAADRDTWQILREELSQDPTNVNSLTAIDDSLLMICLDSVSSNSNPEFTKAMLHGDGVNRWFDKSIQLIIQPQGHAALHFEHSWGDGVAVLRLFNDMYSHSSSMSFETPRTISNNASIRKLQFNISESIKPNIEEVREEFNRRTENLQVKEVLVDRCGRNYFKKIGYSPDACMHLAIQMAYYEVSGGKTAPTYESASTSAFKHGRTETVRPCTTETLLCTKEILSNNKSPKELLSLLKQCSKTHSSLVKHAVMGRGYDRHFFALTALAQEKNLPLPELFTNDTFQYTNHFTISTSTLSSKAVLVGGFAPVVSDGYGVGYMVMDDSVGSNVCTYKSRDSAEFVAALQDSLHKIIDILDYDVQS